MYDSRYGLYIAHCDGGKLAIEGKMANRHGLIAGATGTGKTVTLQVLAETFSQAGVPCFMADMKGDLSGISQTGKMSPFIEKRLPEFFGDEGLAQDFQPCPVRFYDVFGEQGHPMRATISQMGPQLLSRLLGLNETQDGVLNIVFRIADERGLLLIDLKDLRSMLDWVSKHAKEYTSTYGNITTVSAFLCLVWLDAAALRDLGLFGSLMLVGTILFVLIVLPLWTKPVAGVALRESAAAVPSRRYRRSPA